jgi:type I restriction enzyme S subunit
MKTQVSARRPFKSYAEYKSSGVEWLGDVPAHWDVKRNKHVARLESGHTPSRQHPEYWVDCAIPWFGLADVWQIRDGHQEYVVETNEKISELGLANSAARLLPKGTVILSRTASVGFSAILGVDMATTQDFVNWVCGPRIRPEYLLYVLRSMSQEFRRLTMGSTHQTIYMPDVERFSTPVPPIEEQNRIVAFIRHETAKIDALIAKKKRLIGFFQESRTALITHAVTKGIDARVRVKSSGVEWLDGIPGHWKVKKLKAVSSLQTGVTLGKQYESVRLESRPYMRVANVQDGYLDLDDIALIDVPPRDASRYELRVGDVLLTEGGDFDKLARGHVWQGQVAGCLHQNHIFAVRPVQSLLLPDFLALVLSSMYGRAYFTATAKQSTNLASTNSTKLKNFPVPLPDRAEQEGILQFVRLETSKIDALVNRIRNGVDHLNELRTEMISAAVTGKIDLRDESREP